MRAILISLLVIGVCGCGSDDAATPEQPVSTPTAEQPISDPTPTTAPEVATLKSNLTPGQLAVGDPIVNSVGMVLVPIPAGEFVMGAWGTEYDQDDDETRHPVRINKPFYLGMTEVTQSQWESVMGTTPWTVQIPAKEGADYPTTYVHWDDAMEFCRKLSEKEGVKYRLPTEAEWEYACRAGTTTAYSFGDDVSRLGDYAWHVGNSGNTTHPVGEKLPKNWGLFDMHGNVWEWCQDWYGGYETEQMLSYPVGAASGSRRVLRGGAFSVHPENVRAADRNTNRPVNRNRNIGFRVARTYPLSP